MFLGREDGGRYSVLGGGVYGDLISGALKREDALTICLEQLVSDIMADDVYLLYESETMYTYAHLYEYVGT